MPSQVNWSKGAWVIAPFFKLWSVLAVGFVLLAAPLRAQFAYVANFLSNNVSAYSIGSSGALTPIPGSPFAAGFNPSSVAVDPMGRFAYVANSDSSNFPGSGTVGL
jgi:hypothetical protein